MKLQILLAVLLCASVLIIGCDEETPQPAVPDTTAESETVYSAVDTITVDAKADAEASVQSYPLTDFPSEMITYPDCISREIPAEIVWNVLAEEKLGDQTVCVISTSTGGFYAAIPTEEGYTAFHVIHEGGAYAYWNDIELATFSDVFGQSGLHLSYGVGANYGAEIYFTRENGQISILLDCAHRDAFCGDILVESNSYGAEAFCRMEEDGLYRYNLGAYLKQIFPEDTYEIPFPPVYMKEYFYENHRGIFLLRVAERNTGAYIDYAGWLENEMLHIIREEDMQLPAYRYSGEAFERDEAAAAWIIRNLQSDFLLRDAQDPAALDGEELLAYMDEAYRAGRSVLEIYAVSSAPLFAGDGYWYSGETAYIGGKHYRNAQNPVFRSLSAWETYMRSILDDNLVTQLMESALFIELDGELWGIIQERSAAPSVQETGSYIRSASDGEIVYVRCVEKCDDAHTVPETAEYAFRYVKTEEGWRWAELYIYD